MIFMYRDGGQTGPILLYTVPRYQTSQSFTSLRRIQHYHVQTVYLCCCFLVAMRVVPPHLVFSLLVPLLVVFFFICIFSTPRIYHPQRIRDRGGDDDVHVEGGEATAFPAGVQQRPVTWAVPEALIGIRAPFGLSPSKQPTDEPFTLKHTILLSYHIVISYHMIMRIPYDNENDII